VATRLAGPVSGGQDQPAGTAKISEGTAKSFAVFSTPGVVPTQRFRQKAGCGWLIIFVSRQKQREMFSLSSKRRSPSQNGASSPNFSNRRFRDAGLSAIVGARAVDRRHREE
jgi:hypothetical protein